MELISTKFTKHKTFLKSFEKLFFRISSKFFKKINNICQVQGTFLCNFQGVASENSETFPRKIQNKSKNFFQKSQLASPRNPVSPKNYINCSRSYWTLFQNVFRKTKIWHCFQEFYKTSPRYLVKLREISPEIYSQLLLEIVENFLKNKILFLTVPQDFSKMFYKTFPKRFTESLPNDTQNDSRKVSCNIL